MDKQMTIVVAWPAGVGSDTVARLIADGLSKKWGNQVIVENRPGASGNIGQNLVAKAAPDGYTFIVAAPGAAANNMLTFKSLPYNPLTDFTFVTLVVEQPLVFVGGPRLVPKDIKEFFAYAKENPGKIQFGNPGFGTYAHMAQLAVQDIVGAQFNLVPYKGASQIAGDLLASQIDASADLVAGYSGHVKAGKLRVLVVIGDRRSEFVPDVPTLKEAGLNFSASPWLGLEGPKGIPREIVNEMNAAVKEVLANDAVKTKLSAGGMSVRTSTPEEFEQVVKAEVEKWRPIIEKYNIRQE
jgi:tripartite-type tricarboxylate transporter receptor subunit TctC